MPTSLGAHNSRVAAARELLQRKGRRTQGRFTFEGITLLDEALHAGVEVQEVFVTADALDAHERLAGAQTAGIPLYVVDDRTMRKLSDVETPAGIVGVGRIAVTPLDEFFAAPGLVAGLAGVGDPGNAGTLLRSAEAFGVDRVLFGSPAVDPYHPKVVRAAMGALFRLGVAVAGPADTASHIAAWEVTGLAASGTPLDALSWGERALLLVGSERQGLGDWAALCGRFASVPMRGKAESLNAGVAGSIALYEAAKRLAT